MPLAASWTRPRAGTAMESGCDAERLTGPFLSNCEPVSEETGGVINIESEVVIDEADLKYVFEEVG